MNLLRSLLVALALCLALAPDAVAVIETYEFSDPLLEKRYRELSAELRCPKCQNQNIADSDAPIAQDLRRLLHQQLEEGATDEQILDYMVQRYGEFVRYRPRFGGATLILWLAPVLLLSAGIVVLAATLRRRGSATEASGAQLSAAEETRISEMLSAEDRES